METLPPAESAVVQRIASDLKGRPGPLLEVLHAIQAALGYVPGAAVPIVAEVLNLSRAEVHGVVTFYHYFRRSRDRKSTRLNSSHSQISYAVFCLKKKKHGRIRVSRLTLQTL